MNAKDRSRLTEMAKAFRFARGLMERQEEMFICCALGEFKNSNAAEDSASLVQRSLGDFYTLNSWIEADSDQKLCDADMRSLRLIWIDQLIADIEKAARP